MTSAEKLAALAEDENFNLVNIVAIPRSMSTALGRLLCQGSDIVLFVNEPFNRNNQDLEVAADGVLRSISGHLEKDSPSGLTVVTKNMSTYLSDEAFDYLSGVSDSTIWSIRHPLIQIGSLLTRMINDMEVETGARVIDQDHMLLSIDKVSQQLDKGAISSNFSRTGWSSIRRHFDRFIRESPAVVVDGTELTERPEDVVQKICSDIGIEYRPAMVNGWTKGYDNINTGSSRYSTEENAWTREAATTNGVVKNNRPALDLSVLPRALKAHIIDIALPAYEHIRNS